MSDLDHHLQRSLESLESGASLQDSLDELPAGAQDLEDLAHLAADLREFPHPTRSPDSILANERHLIEQLRQEAANRQLSQQNQIPPARIPLPLHPPSPA